MSFIPASRMLFEDDAIDPTAADHLDQRLDLDVDDFSYQLEWDEIRAERLREEAERAAYEDGLLNIEWEDRSSL